MRNGIFAALLGVAVIGCDAGTEEPDASPAVANNSSPTAASALDSGRPAQSVGGTAANLRASVSSLTASVSDLNSRVTDLGTIVELPSDALFEFDSAELGPESEALLRKALPAVRQAPEGPIGFVGHTDSKGEDAYNQVLSERRAQAVADWFGQQPGIRQRPMNVSGRGEGEPVAPNARPDGSDDPVGRARNRRVELVLPNAR